MNKVFQSINNFVRKRNDHNNDKVSYSFLPDEKSFHFNFDINWKIIIG